MRTPNFRKYANGKLNLSDSPAAVSIARENKARGYWGKPKTDEHVRAIALRHIRQQHGVTSNEVDVLGQHELQFGTYRGQTFRWILENCLGYAGWLVMKMEMEAESSKEQPKDNKEQTINKQKFRKYMMHFPEGREAVKIKRETHSSLKQAPSPQSSSVGKSSELKSLVLSSHLTPHALQHRARRLLSPKKVQPSKKKPRILHIYLLFRGYFFFWGGGRDDIFLLMQLCDISSISSIHLNLKFLIMSKEKFQIAKLFSLKIIKILT